MRTILHCVPTLHRGGGMQLQLLNMVQNMDRSRYNHVICDSGFSDDLHPDLVDAGATVVRVVSGFRPRPLSLMVGIRRAIRQYRPDLIHIAIYPSRYASLTSLLSRKPTITTIATSYEPGWESIYRNQSKAARLKHKAFDRLDSLITNSASKYFIAISQATNSSAVKTLGIDPKKVKVIYRGVRMLPLNESVTSNGTTIRQELCIEQRSPILLNVGRLVVEKAQEDAITAMEAIKSRFPNSVMLITGEGPRQKFLEEEITRRGLNEHVKLLGYRVDISELLALADLFVFPSLYEGLGNAALEAGAAGLPIVAYAIPAIREVVEHGESGLLAPSGDVAELTQHILTLLGDDSLRSTMGQRSQSFVTRKFSNVTAARQFEILCDSILDR